MRNDFNTFSNYKYEVKVKQDTSSSERKVFYFVFHNYNSIHSLVHAKPFNQWTWQEPSSFRRNSSGYQVTLRERGHQEN